DQRDERRNPDARSHRETPATRRGADHAGLPGHCAQEALWRRRAERFGIVARYVRAWCIRHRLALPSGISLLRCAFHRCALEDWQVRDGALKLDDAGSTTLVRRLR